MIQSADWRSLAVIFQHHLSKPFLLRFRSWNITFCIRFSWNIFQVLVGYNLIGLWNVHAVHFFSFLHLPSNSHMWAILFNTTTEVGSHLKVGWSSPELVGHDLQCPTIFEPLIQYIHPTFIHIIQGFQMGRWQKIHHSRQQMSFPNWSCSPRPTSRGRPRRRSSTRRVSPWRNDGTSSMVVLGRNIWWNRVFTMIYPLVN